MMRRSLDAWFLLIDFGVLGIDKRRRQHLNGFSIADLAETVGFEVVG